MLSQIKAKKYERLLENCLVLQGVKKMKDGTLVFKAPYKSPLIKQGTIVEIFSKNGQVEKKLGRGFVSHIQTDGKTLHVKPSEKELFELLSENFFTLPKFEEVYYGK